MSLILIIEDAWFTRRTIVKILQKEGYETIEANNGREGLEIIQERAEEIDCIILDMLMPEIDGLGVLAKLQELDINISAIVLTADIQESTRKQCLELGAKAFLNKPPKASDLLETIKKSLKCDRKTMQ